MASESGIRVADACIATYQQLKLGKKLTYILFALSDDLSEIVVEKTSDASDYDAFVDDLPTDQCRFAVYDFKFEKDGKRSKLCFFLWSPDDAKIKDKMIFASSHELRRKLDGIAFEVQASDRSDISYDTVLVKALTSTR